MSTAYIGIGSNLGDRRRNIETALEKLKDRKGIELREVSSVIETEPVGDTQQPKFLNGAFRIETTLYPDELLAVLQSIERELGRNRDSAGRRLSVEEQLRMLQKGGSEADLKYETIADDEKGEGRKERGARTIDLDLLFYDDVMMKGSNLVIPHPLLHERFFVLKPLSEIAPDLIHPVLNKSIRELLSGLGSQAHNETDQEPQADAGDIQQAEEGGQ